MYTLQLIMKRESLSVLWKMCFSLSVVDIMVFTAHGIEIPGLGDRLGINLTLLLTAMAFKWVLNEGTPGVPYLTVMEKYVIATFAALFLQGIAFWFLADAYNYRCGGEEEFSRDWITGVKKINNPSNSSIAVPASDEPLDVSCVAIHVADRLVLLMEILFFVIKNIWFLWRLFLNRESKMKLESNFVDLSYLKEYTGKHMKYVGNLEQCKENLMGIGDGKAKNTSSSTNAYIQSESESKVSLKESKV